LASAQNNFSISLSLLTDFSADFCQAPQPEGKMAKSGMPAAAAT
jgi:hypothetical protein